MTKEITASEARSLISAKPTILLDNGDVLELMFGAEMFACVCELGGRVADFYDEDGVLIVVQCLNKFGKSNRTPIVREYEGKAHAFWNLPKEERDARCTEVRREFISTITKSK